VRIENEPSPVPLDVDTSFVGGPRDHQPTDMERLLTELSGLSRRNNELVAAKDSGLAIICDLDTQLKEYK
jgi:hypothetical protein